MPSTPTELTERELLPCPFCDDRIAHIWSPAQGGYSVICGNGCGAEGPVMENDERAAEAWNRRATHSIQKGEVVPPEWMPLPARVIESPYGMGYWSIVTANDRIVCEMREKQDAEAIVSALNTHRGSK